MENFMKKNKYIFLVLLPLLLQPASIYANGFLFLYYGAVYSFAAISLAATAAVGVGVPAAGGVMIYSAVMDYKLLQACKDLKLCSNTGRELNAYGEIITPENVIDMGNVYSYVHEGTELELSDWYTNLLAKNPQNTAKYKKAYNVIARFRKWKAIS